jgi:hypothetical protein
MGIFGPPLEERDYKLPADPKEYLCHRARIMRERGFEFDAGRQMWRRVKPEGIRYAEFTKQTVDG